MIYFVRANGTDKVKIGYSKDHATFKGRLSSLQTGQPWKLEVLRLIEGGEQWMETWFHQVFASCHTSGEWFVYNPMMMELEPDILTLLARHPRMEARLCLERIIGNLIDLLDQWTPDTEAEPDPDAEPDNDADKEPDGDDYVMVPMGQPMTAFTGHDEDAEDSLVSADDE